MKNILKISLMYKRFTSELKAIIKKHYEAGTPREILNDFEKLISKYRIRFSDAERILKNTEKNIKDKFISNSTPSNLPNTDSVKNWNELSSKLARSNGELVPEIQKILKRGINTNWKIERLAKRISEVKVDDIVQVANERVTMKVNVARHRAEAIARTAKLSVTRANSFAEAVADGVQYFTYSGPVDSSTRKWCAERVGKTFSLKEIEEMDAEAGVQLKPVSVYCGGYRCRHRWIPAINKADSSVEKPAK